MKIRFVLFFLALCFICTSCGAVSNVPKSASYEASYQEGLDFPYDCFDLGVGDYNAARTEQGIYFMVGQYLFFYDYESQKCVPFCNKSDCLHYEETDGYRTTYCDALFYPYYQLIFLYDEKLYASQGNFNGQKIQLMEMNLDGTNRKVLCDLTDCKWPVFHRGVIYYRKIARNEQGVMSYYLCGRSVMEDPDKEYILYTGKYEEGSIQHVYPFGDHVYFNDLDEETISEDFLSYNIQTGEVKLLNQDAEPFGSDGTNLILWNNGVFMYYSPEEESYLDTEIPFNHFVEEHSDWHCFYRPKDGDIGFVEYHDRIENMFMPDLIVVNGEGQEVNKIPGAAKVSDKKWSFTNKGETYYIIICKQPIFSVRLYKKADLLAGKQEAVILLESESVNDFLPTIIIED